MREGVNPLPLRPARLHVVRLACFSSIIEKCNVFCSLQLFMAMHSTWHGTANRYQSLRCCDVAGPPPCTLLRCRRGYDWVATGVDPVAHRFGAVDRDAEVQRGGVRQALQPGLDTAVVQVGKPWQDRAGRTRAGRTSRNGVVGSRSYTQQQLIHL
jgi:hypothetical protein